MTIIMNTNKRVLSLICLLFTLTMLQNTVCLDMDNLFKSEELDLIIEKFNVQSSLVLYVTSNKTQKKIDKHDTEHDVLHMNMFYH